MDSKRKKIVIIGGFGWKDIGDEAMPQAVIYNLRKAIPNLDILMLSPNPAYTTEYHKERSIYDINAYLNKIPKLISSLKKSKILSFILVGKILNKVYPSRLIYFLRWICFLTVVKLYNYKINLPLNRIAKDIINEISSSDLLFNNGGGNINSLLYGELYKQTLTILTASMLDVPVILSGQTIGPITKKIHAFVVKKALNKVDTLTFRDRGISLQRVKEIGITKPIMQDTADDAIGLPFLSQKETEQLILENNGAEWLNLPADLIVAMNMNGYLKAMGKKNVKEFYNEVRLLTKIADQLVEKYKAKILLVPTDYATSSDDRPLLIQIKNKMKHKERALVIEKEYDAIQYKSLIGVGNIAIGARYHFNVFATSMGVPCIGLANGVYQKTKLKGVMELYDLPYCFIPEDMDKVEFDTVWAIIEKVLQNRIEVARQLKKQTKIIQEKSLMTIRHTATLLLGD